MKKLHKLFFNIYFALTISATFILWASTGYSDSNPYNEKGVDLKAKKDLGIRPEEVKTVELQADQVQFSQEKNAASASGNVVITADKTTLYADRAELERTIGRAVANGHVYIDSPQIQVDAERAAFNVNQSTGTFTNARIFQAPFQIKGEKVSKESETHMSMDRGFMTTCDLDEPHFRLQAKRMDIYQNDKAVARGVTMFLGKMPVMYFAKYIQDLKNKPIFTITPGYKKDFGAYLLGELRLKLSDHVSTIVRTDFYERLGLGEGIDLKYDTPSFGSGLLRTYYIHEREIASSHLWNMKNSDGTKKGPTIRHERYKIEWRHKWQVDPTTSVITQYYKLHDYDIANQGFLKRYFEREYRRGPDTTTYFLVTKNLPMGALTGRVESTKINPALQGTDRLPEIQYDLSGQRIGNSNFYLKTIDTFSNLTHSDTSNPGVTHKTMRFDTNNEISYPMKVAFVEMRPWVGGEHTYYSRTEDPDRRSIIRGQYKSGSDLTTHFYKVWRYNRKVLGVDINGLRHVITPSASYVYAHTPSFGASHLYQYDSIDGLTKSHYVHLTLENKLQTKQNKKSLDLIRAIIETDYDLDRTNSGALRPVTSVIEFNPNHWLSFRADQNYDPREEHWNYANFDAYINGGDKWKIGIGKRYARGLDDELTTEFIYKINPKWKFKIYERFVLDQGHTQEEDYILTRDLHEWEMDINYHQERGGGTGIFVAFRLKAFPSMGANVFSSSFHERKAGTQSSTGNSNI